MLNRLIYLVNNALYYVPLLLISLPLHEFAHAYAAYRLGDHTAKAFGRMTLNPLKHLDPVGAICMLLCGFGWAKPVPVNIYNFKDPKKGFALTSLAGPLMNLSLSAATLIILVLIKHIFPSTIIVFGGSIYLAGSDLVKVILNMLIIFCASNAVLAVFNLIPIPPLDGSRLLAWMLPNKISNWLLYNERYIYFVLIALVLLGVFDGALSLVQSFVFYLLTIL